MRSEFMRMTGTLVLMVLMLITISTNYSHCERVDMISSSINLNNSWKRLYGYNQYGHHYFPNQNGCGGDILVTEEYQYGFLTSPNWPGPVPPHAECVWKLIGLSNLFFVVNAIPRGYRNIIRQRSGVLTVRNLAMEEETSFFFGGGDHLESASFLNNSRQEYEIKMTANAYTGEEYIRKGFKLTWWTVPYADFGIILPSELWEEIDFITSESYAERNTTSIGYVFTTHTRSDSVNISVGGLEGYKTLCTFHNVSYSKINFEEGIKSTQEQTCSAQSGSSWLTSLVYNSALVGIEITSPRNIELVYKFAASTIKECPHHKAGDMKLVGRIFTDLFKDAKGNVTYLPKAQCQDYIHLSPNIHDVFLQFRMQTDIQPSPSCVADYLKIGSQRVCGINGPDTYISSPVDNSLIDRTGTYYINIVPHNAWVTASMPASRKEAAHFALNADPSLCYLSHPNVVQPYWVVDLEDVYTVQGVQILPESSLTVTVAVYVKNDEAKPWPVPSYQTCWRGPLSYNKNIRVCRSPVSGQFLAIVKDTPILTLCKVQVFVNIAFPVKAWRNAVYGKEPEIRTIDNIYIDNKHRLVDGDPLTCIERRFLPSDRLKFIFSDDDLAVQAVMLYFKNSGPQVSFKINGLRKSQRDDDFRSEPNTACVSFKGPTDNKEAILLSCENPLTTKGVLLTDIINHGLLCEVIVYADSKDRPIAYAALHKPATKSLLSKGDNLNAPAVVDGNLMSCDSTDQAFFLDLLTLHVVKGIFLHIGDQNGSVFVMVWISPHTAEVNNETSPNSQCCKQQLHVQHEKQKLSLRCINPKLGRYVILQITKGTASIFHLCELQVIAARYDKVRDLQNVALFKHARQFPKVPTPQTSGNAFYYGLGARKVVDGDRSLNDTKLRCTTLLAFKDTQAWLEVDLANIYEVHALQHVQCSEHTIIKQYTIYIYMSNGVIPELCYEGHPFDVINCTPPVLGRIVHLTSSHDMCLCEVEVMAIPLLSYERFGVLPEFDNGSLKQRFSFVTDDHIQNRGFTASYKMNELRNFTSLVDCGEVFRPFEETLMSPESYALPDDQYICHWMIPTPDDGFVVVYIDYMNLRVSSDEDKCFRDALIFSNSAGHQITKCGFMTNESLPIQSFKNDYLHVTLMVRNSDTQLRRKVSEMEGFKLRFGSYGSCRNRLIPLTEGYEQLYSPMYPSPHPPFAWCSWVLKISTTGLLTIIFSALDLNQIGQDCGDDEDEVLRIYSKRQGLHNYCGDKPTQPELNLPVQTGETVTIFFKSTDNKHRKGFHLNYTFHPFLSLHRQVLDYNLNVIESLGYPRSYDPENVSLTWTFTSRNDSGKIHVNFTDLHLWSNGSAKPGSAHFCVDNYLTISSERITLNRQTYNDRTKLKDRYSIFPFYPNSVFELAFKPDPNEGKHHVRFRFSITVLPDKSTVGLPKVLVGEETEVRVENGTHDFTFNQINLNENLPVGAHRFVYIMEQGLYLVSIRVFPMFGITKETLELRVNLQPIDIDVYCGLGEVGSVTAILLLHNGDVLSLVNTRGYGVDKLSMFTVVYVSPAEGGYAFTGLQNTSKESAEYLNFQNVLTSIGLLSGAQDQFEAPVTGIYWVTIRADKDDSKGTYVALYKGQSQTFLDALAGEQIFRTTSAALQFKAGDIFRVRRIRGLSGSAALLSVVLLVYNKQPHTGDHEHIATTVITTKRIQYTEPNQNMVFHSVVVDHGSMLLNFEKITIPRNGLYLVSFRNTLPKPVSGCLAQFLHLKVNGESRYISATLENANTGQMTVLRLNANDILTVSPRQYDLVDNGTLFSIAFVHP